MKNLMVFFSARRHSAAGTVIARSGSGREMQRVQFSFRVPSPKAIHFSSENPLAEVWSQVGRFRDDRHVLRTLRPERISKDAWEGVVSYATIRVEQAIELRQAFQSSGQTTGALPMYYSMLNLTRSASALLREEECLSRHGLRYLPGEQLLGAKAEICSGTFTDYLSCIGHEFSPRSSISLEQCLSNVAEIASDQTSGGLKTQMFPVRTHATAEELTLEFVAWPMTSDEFRETWRLFLPELSDSCESTDADYTLRVLRSAAWTPPSASEYCQKRLLSRLTHAEPTMWYAHAHVEEVLRLPRAAYYFAGMFILSNIVRYEPEALVSVYRGAGRETGWILSRFIKAAERYYPQMMLEHMYLQAVRF